MADLAVRGGRVVLATELREADVLIADGVITEIVAPGSGTAATELDARGALVLPGVVDAHVHVNEPGRAEWEGWLAATRGAAAGGVTTIADMPLNSLPPTLNAAAFDIKRGAAERLAVVDFALWGGLVRADDATLRGLAARGVVGVKAFLCPSGVDEFAHLDADELVPALRSAAAAGLLVAAHCEDDGTIARATAEIGDRRDRRAWLDSRPVIAERIAIERLAAAARETGARVHVVHVSHPDGFESAAHERRSGADLTAETCPHYLAFDAADAVRLGPLLKCAPPIREGVRAKLWERVTSGRVDLIASDHSPCTAELKARGEEDIFLAWGGVSGLQSTLPLMLTEGLHQRRMSPVAIAQLLATRPARRLGLWPRKGEIRVGGDADLAIVDPAREWTLTADALQTRSGLSPYLGRRFRGAVTHTLVRGRVVYRGEVVGLPGDGRFVARVSE
ncbi:MAG TPA: allantoinase AllB [Candidatus Limnocylindria bacterium]|nr:allantoinase AllB [Candidatus Limnocylindria bacterium]